MGMESFTRRIPGIVWGALDSVGYYTVSLETTYRRFLIDLISIQSEHHFDRETVATSSLSLCLIN